MKDYIVSAWKSGDTTTVCPMCDGGRGREVSFSVFEVDDNVLGYKCHRASCSAAGRVRVVGGIGKPVVERKQRSLHLVSPDASDIAAYAAQFGLTDPVVAEYNGKRWFVTYLRDFNGTRFGWHRRIVDKTLLNEGESKAFTHKDVKSPLAYYRSSAYNRTLVVVEDPWSAQRIEKLPSLKMDAAALCGGDWTELCAREAAAHSDLYNTVVLALDKDAQVKAVVQALKLRHIQPVRVVIPRVDFKNMDDDEIVSILTR